MNRVAILMACALALSGCAAKVESGPVAVYEPAGVAGAVLAMDGTIRISSVCVTMVRDEVEYQLAFPVDDVAWDRKTQTLTYLGQPFRDGDPISLSITSDLRTDPSWFPADCPVDRYYPVAPSPSG